MTKKHVVTFGEMLLRLAANDMQRLVQTQSFNGSYAGAEANVAVSLAQFGVPVSYVTRLPENDLGEACRKSLRAEGVDDRHMVYGGSRLGIYFLESGALHRPSKIIYDRVNSSMATIEPGMIDWDSAFKEASWLHWSGITPALSESAAAATREAIQKAKQHGLQISCDLNYRHTLWQWGKKPSQVMPELVAESNLLIANSAEMMLDCTFEVNEAASALERAQCTAQAVSKHYPSIEKIAVTSRIVHSTNHQSWSAALLQGGKFYTAPSYELHSIVNRIGTGDAFMAGLIFGTLRNDLPQQVINFGTAAGALKHSIAGDYNLVSLVEVERLMAGHTSDILR